MMGMVGISCDRAASLDDMLSAMGTSADDGPLEQVPYSVIIMDINLGKCGSYDISPGRIVYEKVKPLVDAGKVYFLSASGEPLAVKLATDAGVPCYEKPMDFQARFMEMLKNLM
jgi:DNA-binding NarL/FixJ family response regulator